eukprot:7849264-Pyramimonas_sp.AAC.1
MDLLRRGIPLAYQGRRDGRAHRNERCVKFREALRCKAVARGEEFEVTGRFTHKSGMSCGPPRIPTRERRRRNKRADVLTLLEQTFEDDTF